MEQNENQKKKKLVFLLIGVALFLLGALIGVMVGGNGGASGDGLTLVVDPDAEDLLPSAPPEKPKEDEGIAIPGYGTIALKAGERDQRVNFFNPEGNNCYFVLSLQLKDGEEIYRSQMIPPGKRITAIHLVRALDAGRYEDALLCYDCYSLNDDLTPLNGAEIVVELNVE
ncbi:MAG: tRNA (uracil-5-)-methyltransferase [Clostridiales bacterium]|nr:tRNA (uracil-5-)-methyltransferase [Clostridiales bacterium]